MTAAELSLCSLTVSLSSKPTITHRCRSNPMRSGCHLFQKLISRVYYCFHGMVFVTKSIFEQTFMSSFVSRKCITISRKRFHILFKTSMRNWIPFFGGFILHLIEVNQPINQTFYQHGAHFNFISKPTPGFKQNFLADISVHIFRFLFVNAFVHPLGNGSVQSPSLHPS